MTIELHEHPLSPTEARVLATLMEKARTVPDSYPMTLNSLASGCNQKTSRDPVMSLSEADILSALDSLRERSLVMEVSGQRAMRWEHNFERVFGVPSQASEEKGGPLVQLLPKAPGAREARWAQLLCGAPSVPAVAASAPANADQDARMAELEARVQALEAQVQQLLDAMNN